jgi:hypothetical protein
MNQLEIVFGVWLFFTVWFYPLVINLIKYRKYEYRTKGNDVERVKETSFLHG